MQRKKFKLSVVIPALNEENGIAGVIRQIPVKKLKQIGFDTEVIVVDNGSTDKTPKIAMLNGAKVIYEPKRGYGNAYRTGFNAASGDIIATGDADMTYPFDTLPDMLELMRIRNIDFINTNRLGNINKQVMSRTHIFGNWLLSLTTSALFLCPFRDSQSGMWVFKREIWDHLDVRAEGMPFSQELKIEAYLKGFKCAEVPISYRARVGEVKLNTFRDGIYNISHLFKKRFTSVRKKDYNYNLRIF